MVTRDTRKDFVHVEIRVDLMKWKTNENYRVEPMNEQMSAWMVVRCLFVFDCLYICDSCDYGMIKCHTPPSSS
jgi:hypothetical protein